MLTQPDLNPYQSGSHQNTVRTITGRQAEIARLYNALYSALNLPATVISGTARMGKTALLRHMASSLSESAVGVYFSWENAPRRWPVAIAQAVARGIGRESLAHNTIEHVDEAAEWLREIIIPHALQYIRPAHNLVICFDDTEKLFSAVQNGTLPQQTLIELENLLKANPALRAVFAISLEAEASLMQAPGLFSNQEMLRLSLFDQNASDALLSIPVKGLYELDDAALRAVHTATGGFPYLTNRFASALYEHWHITKKSVVSSPDITEILPGVASDTREYLDSLWKRMTSSEQAVMQAIASLSYEDPLLRITAPVVQEWLATTDHPTDLTTVHAILRRLEYQNVLSQASHGVRITGNLLQQVVQESQDTPASTAVSIENGPTAQSRGFSTPQSRIGWLIGAGFMLLLLMIYLLLRFNPPAEATQEFTPQPTVTLVTSG